MKVERSPARVLRISEVTGLDTITVLLEDVKPGHGRFVIECWGKSWSAYWGAMGSRSLKDFILQAPAEYVEDCLLNCDSSRNYLFRIMQAVRDALRQEAPPFVVRDFEKEAREDGLEWDDIERGMKAAIASAPPFDEPEDGSTRP